MIKICLHKTALFFAILFMAIIAAPSIIVSFDDTADVTFFYGENEEEEEKENLKLHIEFSNSDSEQTQLVKNNSSNDGYEFKTYQKPHLNVVFPPPDFI